jgi:hypothetical protein
MIHPNSYIFALVIGLVAVTLAYLDSLQTKKTVSKCTYIKLFIGGGLLSILTCYICSRWTGVPIMKGGGTPASLGVAASRQQILTGTPDF